MKNENKLNQDAIELLRKAPKFKDAAEQSKVMREAPDTLNADDIEFLKNPRKFQ